MQKGIKQFAASGTETSGYGLATRMHAHTTGTPHRLLMARPGIRGDGAPAEAPLEPGTAAWQLHQPVTAVDARDTATPDAWIPRHPDLIRLTGR